MKWGLCVVLCGLVSCWSSLGAEIAVIGGGVAGAAAVHFLKQLRPADHISLFEESQSLGGRIQEDHIGGSLVETGATAIHSSNKYMTAFISLANLTIDEGSNYSEAQLCSSGGGVGIWDGASFRFHTSGQDSSLSEMIKLGLTYGLAPVITKYVVGQIVNTWGGVYDLLDANDSTGFLTVGSLFDALKLGDLLTQNAGDYLASKWIGQKFIDEFVDGVSRVNYGQDHSINAFADLVSLAGAGITGTTFSVKEGNSKVVEFLVKEASVHLKTHVDSVTVHSQEGCTKKQVRFSRGKRSRTRDFDAVILAAPFNSAKISLEGGKRSLVPPFPTSYKRTYVTYLEGRLNPSAFGFPDCSQLPDTITTVSGTTSFFRSVALHGPSVHNPLLGIYKLFSDGETTKEQLYSIFSELGVVKRYAYDAYPVLTPLSGDKQATSFAIGEGIFYANVMERTASCMEVESIAGKNVALLANDYLNSQTC